MRRGSVRPPRPPDPLTDPRHERVVAGQFAPRAGAYATSAVHAAGEDLAQLAALAARLRPARALDLGTGAGHAAFALAPHAGEIVAYDLAAEMLDAVRAGAAERGLRNVATAQGSVAALPFDDGAFAMVVSRYSAHHWDDLAAALREARRVVAHGAAAAFVDVVTPGVPLLDTHLQAIEVLRDPSHVRNASLAEWHGALAAAGFAAETTTVRRLRLEFASWIARMRTPEDHVRAIRSLQRGASREVAERFALEPDGSFSVDVATVEARAV